MRFLLAVIFLLISHLASGADKSWYVGAAIGNSDLRDSCATSYGSVVGCDDDSAAYQLFGGVNVNKYLAIELGWVDLGKSDTTAYAQKKNGQFVPIYTPPSPSDPVYTGSSSWKAKGVEASAVGSYPLDAGVSALGKLGVLWWDADYHSSINGSQSSYSKDGASLTYGVGFKWQVTKPLALRVLWQQYLDVDVSDVATISIGATFSF